LLYSRGSGGVKKDLVGGEYDGIFPECMGNVGDFCLCPVGRKRNCYQSSASVNVLFIHDYVVIVCAIQPHMRQRKSPSECRELKFRLLFGEKIRTFKMS
jgi:hypothetical protein